MSLSRRWSLRLGLLAPLAVVGAASPHQVDAQVTGVVTDPSGRPLPFVVVTSRTRNGFWAVLTDARGRFDFRTRPHANGDQIRLHTAGYRDALARLTGPRADLAVTLQPTSDEPIVGWTIGLPHEPSVEIQRASDAQPLNGAPRAGEVYQIVIAAQSEECVRPGEWIVTRDSARITVVPGAFVRSGNCAVSTEPAAWVVDHTFEQMGTTEIRVRGRWRDVVLTLNIR